MKNAREENISETIKEKAVDIKENIKEKIDSKKTDEQKRLEEIIGVLNKYELIKEGLNPEKLRMILEDLGPTFVKLGQVMSMRTDFLPKEYCCELEKLRTGVRELTFEEVKDAIEEELSLPLGEVFREFDEKPIGSASIAQVHTALLADGESRVVVKVQRPGIRKIMQEDIQLMRRAVKMLKILPAADGIDLADVVEEMWAISKEELDFMVEASHIKEFYENNRYDENISCPVVNNDLTCSKILVMEYVDGYSVGDAERLEADNIDRDALGYLLTENYMKQVLDDGFFHADPHPGNIRIRDGQIVWIDMGMMGRLTPKDRKLFKKAVGAVVKKDINGLISVLMSMGMTGGNISYSRLYGDIDNMLTKYTVMDMGDVDLAVFLDEMLALMKKYGITVPKGLSMLTRGVLTLQGVLAEVSPDVNIIDVAAEKLAYETISEFDIKKEIKNTVSSMLNSGSKAIEIPALAADLMEATIKGHTKVNLDLTGSEEILKKVSKMINRVVAGLICASLIIGSSMLSAADNTPGIFGVSVGFIGFIAAAALGIWTIIDSKKD